MKRSSTKSEVYDVVLAWMSLPLAIAPCGAHDLITGIYSDPDESEIVDGDDTDHL